MGGNKTILKDNYNNKVEVIHIHIHYTSFICKI